MGAGIEPADLRVMSPVRCHFSTPLDLVEVGHQIRRPPMLTAHAQQKHGEGDAAVVFQPAVYHRCLMFTVGAKETDRPVHDSKISRRLPFSNGRWRRRG